MFKIGTVLYSTFDEYSIISQIGQGGNGTVFKARNSDGKIFAVKSIFTNVSRDKTNRFKNEMEFCRKYNHKNIVKIIDSGRFKDDKKDILFYVMPFYEETLRSRIESGLSPNSAVDIFLNILAGLEFAHNNNAFHRDIKPENILLRTGSNEAVIADFGIAHFCFEDLIATVETKITDRLANFKYAAPEQKSQNQIVDGRADVFACGLILNEMFTKQVVSGTRYTKITDIYADYDFLDTIFDSLYCQNPNDRLYPVQKIIIELKVLSEKKNNEIEIRDLINKKLAESVAYEDMPVPLVESIDYSNHILKFELSFDIPEHWANLLTSGSYARHSLVGYEPNRFRKQGKKSFIVNIINNESEQTLKSLVRYFKEWLFVVTNAYNDQQKREIESQRRTKEQAIQNEIDMKEKENKMRDFLSNLL